MEMRGRDGKGRKTVSSPPPTGTATSHLRSNYPWDKWQDQQERPSPPRDTEEPQDRQEGRRRSAATRGRETHLQRPPPHTEWALQLGAPPPGSSVPAAFHCEGQWARGLWETDSTFKGRTQTLNAPGPRTEAIIWKEPGSDSPADPRGAHPGEQDGGRHLSFYHKVTGKCHSGILLAH